MVLDIKAQPGWGFISFPPEMVLFLVPGSLVKPQPPRGSVLRVPSSLCSVVPVGSCGRMSSNLDLKPLTRFAGQALPPVGCCG